MRFTFVAMLICAASVSGAQALDVRGRVNFRTPPEPQPAQEKKTEAAAMKVSYWDEWNGYVQPRTLKVDVAREYVIALCARNGTVPPKTGESKADLWGGAFYPSTLLVPAQSKLVVRNQDGFEHVVFGEGPVEAAPMPLAPGRDRALQVRSEGVGVLRDTNDPAVIAHVHVRKDVVVAAPVENGGAYSFGDVEPGFYVLKVFRGNKELFSQVVSVHPKRRKDKRMALETIDVP